MSKPNPHKRKSETQELTLNPRAAQKARTNPPPQNPATEFSDAEMEDKRTGVRKMTAVEETILSEGIAALSRRHMRIAIEIIRRGAPGLAYKEQVLETGHLAAAEQDD
ncbi:hypothetical protein BLS_002473 [Venturia inaequalis]|uniref:Uncharacterized protein n=1 Tax=Venturia inaequalis TaxID=5025 RepID=A0A8H3UUT6_VENIN|nr:hypothetical protein BLS_002473 [Venturia inaequalis]